MPEPLLTRFAVLVFSDIVGSTDLKARHGVPVYREALRIHNLHFEELARQCQIRIIQNSGDGYFAEAASITDAVRFALLFQQAMRSTAWNGVVLTSRLGIHAGEVTALDTEGGSGMVAPAVDLASRVMSLAVGGQILLTRFPFDEARYFLREHPHEKDQSAPPLCWMAHGPYFLKGRDEPIDIFEVGAEQLAPLTAPPGSEKAKRAIRPGEEETLGWRPAVGLEIPGRPNWRLIDRIGAGGFGEVWAAEHSTFKQRRAFKFCFDDQRLRALKREVTLVRLLRSALGDRSDIVQFHELKLDEPPFYIESDLAPHGNLSQWAEARGGLATLSLQQRIDLVVDTATALAAAHSVGVLHKDIKPTNVLIFDGEDGQPRARLVDFGIGTVAHPDILQQYGVTAAGFTQATIEHSTGTPTYSPPEYLAGKPYTVQGDIYGLGILLFQMLVADASHPLAPGWERDIPDPLLRADIAACVDGEPARRLSSATELAERLKNLEQRRADIEERENLAREAAALKEAEARAAAERTRSRHLRRLAVTFGLLALLAAGAGVVAWFNKRKADAAVIQIAASERIQRQLREQAEMQAYASDMYVASQLTFHGASIAAVAKIVNAWEHREVDRRGWEWSFLKSVCAPDVPSFGDGQRPVKAAAWSPDGSQIAITQATEVVIYQIESRRELRRLTGHSDELSAVAWTAEGSRLASSARDRTIRIWNADSGEQTATIPHIGTFAHMAWDPQGKRFAVGSQGESLHVFSRDGTPAWKAEVNVWGIAWHPNGERFATIDEFKIRIWDANTGSQLRLIEPYGSHGGGFGAISWSPDGKVFAVGDTGFGVSIIEADTGKRVTRFAAANSTVTRVAWSSDGNHLATSSRDEGTIAIWTTNDWERKESLRGHLPVTSLAWHPSLQRVASASADGTAKAWELDNPDRPIAQLSSDNQVTLLAWRKGGGVATPLPYEFLKAWNVELASVEDRSEKPVCFEWNPARTHLASGSSNGTVKLWDAMTGKVVWRTKVYPMRGISWSPDGQRFACAGNTQALVILDTKGDIIRSIGIDGWVAMCVAWSPDGRCIAMSTEDGIVRLLDSASGETIGSMHGHRQKIRTLAWSPNGRWLASGSEDCTARIWDVTSCKEVYTLAAHSVAVDAVAWNPDSSRVATGSWDTTIKVWNPATGQLLCSLETGTAGGINGLAWSDNGQQLAYGTVRDRGGIFRAGDVIRSRKPKSRSAYTR
jgi:WD40 repeat protein/class 3 adenylate cyclase